MSVNVAYKCLILQGSLTFRKILQHGTNGFISPPKEVVLGIFIAIKSSSPRRVIIE
jgi:hypothetical protein